MKRGGVLLFVLMAACTVATNRVLAQQVSYGEARRMATDFFTETVGPQRVLPRRIVATTSTNEADAPYYMFADSENKQYVVIAGNEQLPSILGYGSQPKRVWYTRIEQPLPENMQEWLNMYVLLQKTARKDGSGQGAVGVRRTVSGEQGTSGANETYAPIAPLLQDDWKQEAPFNGLCPYYTYDNGTVSTTRCLVGCVATSLSQVMHYYRYPEQVKDTIFGWQTDHYELEDILPGAVIDWKNIRDHYEEGTYSEAEAQAVAQLSLYCSMLCKMNFGLSASGARVSAYPTELARAMGYQYTRYYDRTFYTPEQWNHLLRNELENSRPILYAGYNIERSGHAFVIDGMDADGLYHLNWGYGGEYNGYFNLDILNPFESPYDVTENGQLEGFYCNQEAVLIHPDPQENYPLDSLPVHYSDIEIDSVLFHAPFTTAATVPMDFYVTSHKAETVTYPVALITWTPSEQDSIVVATMHYAAIGGATLPPEECTRIPLRCTFTTEGPTCFGITFDGDSIFVCSDTLMVDKGKAVSPRFGTLQLEEVRDSSVTFQLSVQNTSADYWCTPVITYCLYEGNKEQPDQRHWFMPVLGPEETVTDTLVFKDLLPDTEYILALRYPWSILQEYPFTTTSTAIGKVVAEKNDSPTLFFNIEGKRLPEGDIFNNRSKQIRILKKGNNRYKIFN